MSVAWPVSLAAWGVGEGCLALARVPAGSGWRAAEIVRAPRRTLAVHETSRDPRPEAEALLALARASFRIAGSAWPDEHPLDLWLAIRTQEARARLGGLRASSGHAAAVDTEAFASLLPRLRGVEGARGLRERCRRQVAWLIEEWVAVGLDAGRLDEAPRWLELLHDVETPGERERYLELTAIYHRRAASRARREGELDRARDHLQRAAEAWWARAGGRPRPDDLVQAARCAREAGRPEAVLTALRRFDPAAHRDPGLVERRWTRQLEARSQVADALLETARARLDTGDPDTAAYLLRLLLREIPARDDPRRVEALLALARVELAADRGGERAIEHLRGIQAPVGSPRWTEALYLRALAREAAARVALREGLRAEASRGRERAVRGYEEVLNHTVGDGSGAGGVRGRDPTGGPRLRLAWRAARRLASLSHRRGDHRKARVAYDCLAALDARSIRASRAFTIPEARRAVSEVEAAPFLAAEMAFRAGDDGSAVGRWETALTEGSGSWLAPWGHLRLGRAWRAAGVPEGDLELELAGRRLRALLDGAGGGADPVVVESWRCWAESLRQDAPERGDGAWEPSAARTPLSPRCPRAPSDGGGTLPRDPLRVAVVPIDLSPRSASWRGVDLPRVWPVGGAHDPWEQVAGEPGDATEEGDRLVLLPRASLELRGLAAAEATASGPSTGGAEPESSWRLVLPSRRGSRCRVRQVRDMAVGGELREELAVRVLFRAGDGRDASLRVGFEFLDAGRASLGSRWSPERTAEATSGPALRLDWAVGVPPRARWARLALESGGDPGDPGRRASISAIRVERLRLPTLRWGPYEETLPIVLEGEPARIRLDLPAPSAGARRLDWALRRVDPGTARLGSSLDDGQSGSGVIPRGASRAIVSTTAEISAGVYHFRAEWWGEGDDRARGTITSWVTVLPLRSFASRRTWTELLPELAASRLETPPSLLPDGLFLRLGPGRPGDGERLLVVGLDASFPAAVPGLVEGPGRDLFAGGRPVAPLRREGDRTVLRVLPGPVLYRFAAASSPGRGRFLGI